MWVGCVWCVGRGVVRCQIDGRRPLGWVVGDPWPRWASKANPAWRSTRQALEMVLGLQPAWWARVARVTAQLRPVEWSAWLVMAVAIVRTVAAVIATLVAVLQTANSGEFAHAVTACNQPWRLSHTGTPEGVAPACSIQARRWRRA